MKRLIYTLLLIFITMNISAQNTITVTGMVTEKSSLPIIGASILVKGTNKGTMTDEGGKFTLENIPSNATLICSYVGMKSTSININGDKVINITLESSSVSLDEVVVVAYGTQTKRTLTSSISTLGANSIKDIPVNSVDQAFQGRVTGVSIITPTGGVGESPIIRIRGVASITSGTSPLYVVDGVPVDNGNLSYTGNANALSDLNPNDIASMDVLKDAAAAMYGSRAANGVILITTKSGLRGKTKVSYNGYVGITTRSNFFDVMNAQQYVDFKNAAVKNRYGTDEMSLTSGYTSAYGNKAFNMWKRSDGSYVNTDWAKEVFRTGLENNHTVSIEGGTMDSQYYISGNYAEQKGMIKGDKYNRFGINAKVSANANKWLKIGGGINGSVSTTKSTDGARNGGEYATEGFTRLAIILPPNVPAYNEDGTPYLGEGGYIGTSPNTVYNGYTNPVALLKYGSGKSSEIEKLLTNVFAEIRPINNLVLRTQYGLDYNHIDDKDFRTAKMYGDTENGQATNYSAKRTTETWTNTASYQFSIGKNNFDVLLGEESTSKKLNRWGATRSILLDDKYTTFQGAWSSISAGDGNTISESSLLSYFSRLNYDYDSKYLISFNFRRDGFSALSENHRWGNFGGVSAAWRVSSESFFKPWKSIVNDLKIKGSLGIVGNTNIGDYASYSYYSSSYYGSDGAFTIGQIADSKNLKWESSKKYDLGFSTMLWNKINVDFDYYNDVSSDLILAVPVSPSKGIPNNSITTNAGAMKNYGIELNVGLSLIHSNNFSWTSSFNVTTTKNKVTKLAKDVDDITTGEYNITKIGKPIGELYLYPTGGIDKTTGRRIFYGADGTKVLCMYEKAGKFFKEDGTSYAESSITPVICGNTLPTYYGGWSNDLKYKNFDLSILLQFSGGNKIYNGTKATTADMRYWNNTIDVLKNYWRTDRTNAKYAYPIYGDNYSNGSAKPFTDWVEKGDYIRLKNVILGYTFDLSHLGKIGISSIRLYAEAQNLFVITKYSGLDPEASTMDTNPNLQDGVDKNTLPQARVFTLGANLKF